MPALGIGIVFFGYWVTYYGLTQITSGNWGFLDLGVPGRWTADAAATPRDGPQTTDTGKNQGATNPSSPTGPSIQGGAGQQKTVGGQPITGSGPGNSGPGFPLSGPGKPTAAPGSTGDTTPYG